MEQIIAMSDKDIFLKIQDIEMQMEDFKASGDMDKYHRKVKQRRRYLEEKKRRNNLPIYTKEEKKDFFKFTRFDEIVLQNEMQLQSAEKLHLQKETFEGLCKGSIKFYMILPYEAKIELDNYAEIMACILIDVPFVIEKNNIDVTYQTLNKMSKLFE